MVTGSGNTAAVGTKVKPGAGADHHDGVTPGDGDSAAVGTAAEAGVGISLPDVGTAGDGNGAVADAAAEPGAGARHHAVPTASHSDRVPAVGAFAEHSAGAGQPRPQADAAARSGSLVQMLAGGAAVAVRAAKDAATAIRR